MHYFEEKTTQEKKLIFAMMLSSILPLLDTSIVNVILSTISENIGVSYVRMQWVVIVYMLACAAGILLSPFAGKRYGVKTTWTYSLSIFLIGSVMVGLSFDAMFLIISRCIQGVGAGVLISVSQSILAIQFGKERLRPVMALIAIPAVFAPAVGPLLGVVLSDVVSWRLAFFINVPLVLMSLFLGMKVLPKTDKFDVKFNSIVFSAFFISLTIVFLSINFYLTQGMGSGFSLGALVLGVFLLILSITLNNKSKCKIINLTQFSNHGYCLSVVMGFFISVIFFGFLVFFPLLMALQDGTSLLYVGYLLALQGGGAWIVRRYIYPKCSAYSSFLIAGGGVIVSALSILFIENGGVLLESAGFLVRGAGLGIATIATLSAPFEFGQNKYIHDTSAITRVIQQIGGAFGGLMSGTVIHSVGGKLITIDSAYQIFFLFSLLIGVFSILVACFIKKE